MDDINLPATIDVYKLVVSIRTSFLTSAYENGHITLDDLLTANPLDKLSAILKDGPDGEDPNVDIVIDHRETILKDARSFAAKGQHEYAQVFYALYFEHEINALLTHIMTRKDISRRTSLAVVKHSISDKLTWVMELLEVKPPRKEFLDFIKPLSDDRNAFIHYKWIGKNINHQDNEQGKDYEYIDREVAYFRRYVSHVIYRGKKGVVMKRIDDLAKGRED